MQTNEVKQTSIPYTIKHQCVALHKSGKTNREIYNVFLSETASKQSFDSFKRSMAKWKNKIIVDDKFVKDTEILHIANLGLGFDTNKATIQINHMTKDIERSWVRVEKKEKSKKSAIDRIIEAIEKVKPFHIEIEPFEVNEKRMLEIPFFDSHFGVSDYEYYKPTQMKTLDKISSRKWEEILFVIGQDCLHNDNFRGQTASGTVIENIDMVKAWNDCHKFYGPMIEHGLKQSKKVKVMYSPGNHDESMTWAFVQFLKALYPQCEYDDNLEERKVHTFGKNFIGITHGDKARKNLHNIFPIEFPIEWSKAKNREIHLGHFHKEDANDIFGMMVRTLATRNKTDKWHKQNGFIGAHKRFMLFEWSEEELESIHYV